MYCNQCGSHIGTDTTNCHYCGAPNRNLTPMDRYSPSNVTRGKKLIFPSNPPKNPLLMAILSGCCINGLGQIILGQTLKGVALLVGSVVLMAATSGISLLIALPVIAIDAYLIGKKLEAGNPVEEWEFF